MNSPHFIVDAEGQRTAVILDLATYEQMLEDLEGLPLDEALAAA